MSILVGIDEAGYGPLMGPLVVSGTAFSIPQNHLKADLWSLLQKAISKDKKKLSGRLLINDSKKAFSRKQGTQHLLRTVTACLNHLAKSNTPMDTWSMPQTVLQLLNQLCPSCCDCLAEYPWYHNLSQAPMTPPKDIGIASAVFGKTLADHQMDLVWVQSRFLEVSQYNQRVEKIKNKSRVLFIEICSLIQYVLDHYCDSDGPIQFLIDRQGGRMQYHQELLRMFPGMELTILIENETLSSYEMSAGGRSMRLHFAIESDSKYMPVSLASMISKLVRELLMDEMNRYFRALYPDIKETAGYWQDGLRFIDELRQKRAMTSFPESILIRQK